jgi:hypothetical protein
MAKYEFNVLKGSLLAARIGKMEKQFAEDPCDAINSLFK